MMTFADSGGILETTNQQPGSQQPMPPRMHLQQQRLQQDKTFIDDRCFSASMNEQRKRSRKLLTMEQTKVLERILEKTVYPSTSLREAIARQLGIAPRKVQIWFQNKRQGRRKSPSSSSASAEEKSCLSSSGANANPEVVGQGQEEQLKHHHHHHPHHQHLHGQRNVQDSVRGGHQYSNLVASRQLAPLSAPAATHHHQNAAGADASRMRARPELHSAPWTYHRHDDHYHYQHPHYVQSAKLAVHSDEKRDGWGVSQGDDDEGGDDDDDNDGVDEAAAAATMSPHLPSNLSKREVLFSPARQNSIACKSSWSTTAIGTGPRPRPSPLTLPLPLRGDDRAITISSDSVAAINTSHSSDDIDNSAVQEQQQLAPQYSTCHLTSSSSFSSSSSSSAVTPLFPDDVLGRQHIEAGLALLSSGYQQQSTKKEKKMIMMQQQQLSFSPDMSLLLAPITARSSKTHERHIVLPSISELIG